MMKESDSPSSKMLNRNWVLKRKRRKLPSGPDVSNGKEKASKPLDLPSNDSPKCRVKNEVTSSHSSGKKKGNDGYYYECVVCDLGGNLLCCESCPRTYHIQCLDPPLKRIPTGKWECPTCCRKNDTQESVDPLDTVSKRARTKVTGGKAKNEKKSSGTSKVSLIFDSSIPGKKRSSGKERTPLSHLNQKEKLGNFSNDVSCDIEPSHHSPAGAADGSSLHIGVDKEKEVPPADTSLEKEVLPSDTPAEKEVPSADTPLEKPSSSMNDATPSLNKMDSEINDKASEKKPDLPSSDRSPGGEPVAVLEAATRKDRKRKPNFYNTDSQNKSRTDKGKRPADNTKKSGSKTSKSQKKRKRVNNQPSVTASDRNGKETVETQLNDELVSEEVGQPSDRSREAGKVAVEPLIYDTNDPGLQQVDKVLGCRVQVDNISHSHDIPGISANDPALGDSAREEVNDGKPSCDVPVVEVGKEYSGSGSQETLDIPDKGKSSKDDTTKDNMQVYRRSGSRECKEGTGTVKEDSQGSVSEGAINNSEEDIAVNADDYLANKKNASRESNDSTEKNYNDKGKSKGNVTSGTHEVGTGKGKNEMITADTTSFKKSEETVSATPSTSNSVNVVYEYLVKWVGKSNIHNSWIPESELKILAKRKLDNYKAKYGTATINICDEQWKLPQRIIATRPGTGGSDEVFVRWTGLPYDECTWEKIEEPVIAKSSHLINQFNQFESQALNRNATKDDVVRKRKECLKNDIVTLTEQPRELGGSLFPHQMEALNWLRKCWHKSKNVILADEMGLGKTISASAFLSSLYTEFNTALPSLVLVPLSTMPNWMAEFQLWAPHLNVVEYHGTAKARSVIRQFEWHARDRSDPSKRSTSYKFNVLLTTYEMILVDSSYLRGIPWEVLVVDEGHRLKNSSSKLFSMLNTFSFQHRVLLTGTPLQNNIGEMYNLLNFLQPSSFPSLSSFEEKFTDLTTAEKVEELKKLVAPHMLRRLKKDAMQNIPPKTERVVPVELTSIQAEYYRAMLTKNYQLLRNIGKGIAQQSMLNIVMQLRKVCNHPYLIPGTEPESGSLEFLHEMRIKASGKLTLLHSMLKCLHKEGHRVLIFSQMTKLLDILEDYLAIEFGQKTYERVDGSVAVADRQAAIARFNQDKSRFVFLLSTRSCGLGINLATADTVIIYDSDFNPHADIQAMNRAHRIGQSKRLLVYRLVVRASVEERILQLAKRKLMLDQLFVNKSGSQKEVEDILRWGTEELFSDSSSMAEKDAVENSSNKDETVPEVEHKRKRTGSLGDVYKDKCTKGSTMIVWDENAILKLLDRSNLQSESPDNNEAELENDMLGSVKSLEWNEEGAEEQAGIASDMVVSEDTCVQNVEKKEDNLASSSEENEWDKLLRVRWEKYQSEEEAALGRGKRQRKAISYREAYASHPNETLSESTAEEEQEPVPVPEPEREYSQAGRALKEKYAKLRAKQKERLARRNEIGASGPVEGQAGRESPCHLLPPQAPYVNLINVPSQHREEKPVAMNLDNNSRPKSSETQKNMGDSTLRLGKLKHKLNDNIDFPSRGHPVADIPQSSKLAQDMSYVNSVNKQLLPVLGLCAPNAHQAEAPQRNLSKSNIRPHRQGLGLDFPTIAPPELSTEMVAKGLPRRFRLPDLPVDPSQQPPKNIVPDSYLPFNPHPRSLMRERGSVGNLKKSGATLSDIQDRTALPKPLDKPLLPRYPFPAMNMPRPSSGLLPNLCLGSRVADVNESVREHPVLPFLPNLKFPPHDAPRFNLQEQEMLPARGLGHMAPPSSSFPENHWKVLENIMLRTGLGSGSGSGNLLKRRNKLDVWSEDELDCLWIGVRRHGRGNWDTMLRDPKLKFSKYRRPEDLSIRWEEEQLKIVDGPALPAPKPSKPTKVGKSGLFSGISDEMMARALHGCKLNGQLLPAHLTDMKLGFGNLPSSFPHLEPPERLGFNSQHISHLPTPSADKYQVNIPRDLNAGPSDRAGAPSSFLTESPFLLNSSGSSSLGPLGLGCQNKFDLEKENDDGASRSVKLPSLLDKPINISHDSRNNAGARESSNYPSFPVLDKGQKVPQSKGKEVVESSSPRNKLPHWLREAVSTPAKLTEPDLPPTVTAIAQSVRMLYGEEKPPFIPPFVIPSPPPTQPRDPRLSLKKKKKKQQQQHGLQAVRQFPIDFAGTIDVQGCNLHGESMAGTSMAGTSILQDPAFPLLSRVMGRTSGLPSDEANLNMPPPSVNVNPSSSTFPLTKTSTGLSPSPEVLQLVASCVAPGPPVATGSSFLGNMASLPTSVDQVASSDSQDSHEKQEADHTLAPSTWVPFQAEKEVETDSRDSSKTQSDSARARQEHVEEMSSEGTVSDHQKDDHEP